MDGYLDRQFYHKLDCEPPASERFPPSITARLAMTDEVLKQAWSVRHAAYSSRGYIEKRDSGIFSDEWDFSPATKIIVIYRNSIPVATVRVCLFSSSGNALGFDKLPSMDRFQKEIDDISGGIQFGRQGVRIAEVLRLCRHPDLGDDAVLVFALFRMVGYVLLDFGADAVISAIRRNHIPFYLRMGFRKIAEPRPSAKLKFETGLLACVRRYDEPLKNSMPVLGLIDSCDTNVPDFFSGKEIPVFKNLADRATMSDMFGGRFEGIQAMRGAGSVRRGPAQEAGEDPLAA